MRSLQKPVVLMVEDNPTGIASLVGILSSACELVIAKCLSEARNCIDPEVDLVLLDLYLPDGKGIDFLKELKANPVYTELPVICISASDQTNDIENAFREGAIDYVLKPFNRTILSAKVSTFINFKRKSDLLASQAMLDPLTGIGNRRLFDQRLDLEWRRARRQGLNIGLALIDLDNFKSINDRYGHAQGDACLRQVANALTTTFSRAEDVVARLGGDEFVAIFPGATVENVVRAAQRLQCELENKDDLDHYSEQAFPEFTVSIGCWSLQPERSMASDALIEQADKYLYEAKDAGGRACIRPVL